MEKSRHSDKKEEGFAYKEVSRDNEQKRCVYKLRNTVPKSFFNYH